MDARPRGGRGSANFRASYLHKLQGRSAANPEREVQQAIAACLSEELVDRTTLRRCCVGPAALRTRSWTRLRRGVPLGTSPEAARQVVAGRQSDHSRDDAALSASSPSQHRDQRAGASALGSPASVTGSAMGASAAASDEAAAPLSGTPPPDWVGVGPSATTPGTPPSHAGASPAGSGSKGVAEDLSPAPSPGDRLFKVRLPPHLRGHVWRVLLGVISNQRADWAWTAAELESMYEDVRDTCRLLIKPGSAVASTPRRRRASASRAIRRDPVTTAVPKPVDVTERTDGEGGPLEPEPSPLRLSASVPSRGMATRSAPMPIDTSRPIVSPPHATVHTPHTAETERAREVVECLFTYQRLVREDKRFEIRRVRRLARHCAPSFAAVFDSAAQCFWTLRAFVLAATELWGRRPSLVKSKSSPRGHVGSDNPIQSLLAKLVGPIDSVEDVLSTVDTIICWAASPPGDNLSSKSAYAEAGISQPTAVTSEVTSLLRSKSWSASKKPVRSVTPIKAPPKLDDAPLRRRQSRASSDEQKSGAERVRNRHGV